MQGADKIAEIVAREWDAVVVGSGLAGSFAALKLARAGHSVLIIEQAPAPRNGNPPEVLQLTADFALDDAPRPAFELLEAGRSHRLTVQVSRGCPYQCEFCASSILSRRATR